MNIQEIKNIVQQELMNNITDRSSKLNELYAALFQELMNKRNDRSFELNELYAALFKAQAEMKIAGKNSSNFRNKYADLAEIVNATRPSLTKYGLSVIQKMDTDNNGNVFLCTILCHESGQWIDSRVPIRIPHDDSKNEIQAFGSIITYLRRYSYAALICCVTADESDDDGIAASSYKKSSDKITEKQHKYLEDIIKDIHGAKPSILSRYNISDLSDMNKSDFNEVLEKLRVKQKSS